MHGTISRPAWFADWSGDVCALIASGPSVTKEDVDKLQGRCRVAVVNNNHELAPWADLLYAADGRWWEKYPKARNFGGLKVTPDAPTAKRYGLHHVNLLDERDTDSDRISVDRPGMLARGGNSAFQLLNLVTQFGVRRQIWLGFDFTGEHWHGKHPEPLRNPKPQTLEKWRKRFDAQADLLKSLGVDVVNASADSALTAYQKLDVSAALHAWSA